MVFGSDNVSILIRNTIRAQLFTLFLNSRTSSWKKHKKNGKRKQFYFLLGVKTKKVPQEKLQARHPWERECRCMICDNYEQSLVCSPRLAIHLCNHMSFSPFLAWIAGEKVKNKFHKEQSWRELVRPWTACDMKQKYVLLGLRGVSQASTAASVRRLRCGRWFNGCHSSNRRVRRQDSSQS